MVRVPIGVHAAEQARWLAELADALEQAQDLVEDLGRGPVVLDLSARVAAARAHVRALRLGPKDGVPPAISSRMD